MLDRPAFTVNYYQLLALSTAPDQRDDIEIEQYSIVPKLRSSDYTLLGPHYLLPHESQVPNH